MNKNTANIIVVIAIILATAVMRIVNVELHIYNLVPVAALGIFSGSVLKNKFHAYIIPLLAMLISDMGIAALTNMRGFYGISQFVNYGTLVLITFIGTFLNKRNILNIAGYSIGGTLVFFVLSNFGTFLSGELYPRNLSGLLECYTMALPFYKSELANTFFFNSLLGDLCFSFAAFGLYHLAKQNIVAFKLAK